MNTGELIKELSKFNKNLEVVIDAKKKGEGKIKLVETEFDIENNVILVIYSE